MNRYLQPFLHFVREKHYTQDGKTKLTEETDLYFQYPLTECVNEHAPHYSSFTPPTHRETLFVEAHNDFFKDKLGL